MKKEEKKQEIKFEEALEKLESIVNELETGKADLDKSLKLFEEGIKLSRFCNQKINEAKQKIEVLTKENGKFTITPFEPDNTQLENKDSEIDGDD